MSDWGPPQVGGTPEIPVAVVETAPRWWKRRYRRVPVWGWAIGGLIALVGVSAALAPPEDEQLATANEAAPTTVAADTFVDLASTTSAPEPPATAAPTETTTAATIAMTLPVPTTTSAPPTSSVAPSTSPPTQPPVTISVITQPPTNPATTSPPTLPPPSAPTVDIAIRFDADGNDNQNKNDEWVRFGNGGSSALDMTGWVVQDEGPNHTYRFGPLVLQPGEFVILFTGCGTDGAFSRFWCNPGSAIWNNDGDTVSLYDAAGALVAQRSG